MYAWVEEITQNILLHNLWKSIDGSVHKHNNQLTDITNISTEFHERNEVKIAHTVS